MQMNIPAMFGPICFSGSLEEDWNVYGRTTDGRQVIAIAHLTRMVSKKSLKLLNVSSEAVVFENFLKD